MYAKTFEEVLKHPYVVILDNATGNKLHRTTCSFVKRENFNQKVNSNLGKNGYYLPLDNCNDIKDTFVRPCKVCRPT